MNVPGEGVLIKMWDSLIDKGIGGLLTPWQMRRKGVAAIELKAKEMIAVAEAEREVELIRAGKRAPFTMIEPLLLKGPDVQDVSKLDQSEGVSSAELVAIQAQRADSLRREVNVARAVLAAEEAISSDADQMSDAPVDADWLYRWRDSAACVSNEDMQKLWGNVLAGEVKAPGRYSLRTLDFLRNLSKPEAEVIELASQFVVEEMIWLDKDSSGLTKWLTFDNLLLLQGIGLVNGVEGMLNKSWRRPAETEGPPIFLQTGRTSGLLIKGTPVHFQVPCLTLSSLGKEVFSLCDTTPNEPYLRAFGASLKSLGVAEVHLCVGTPVPGGFQVVSGTAI